MTTKLFDTVPAEIMEAVRTADLYALRQFRKSLTGDEEIYVRDTVPLFDFMQDFTKKSSPEEEASYLDTRNRLLQSERRAYMYHVVRNLEQVVGDCLEDKLRDENPALYAAQKALEKREKRFKIPAEIAAALETRRPQLLAPIKARVAAGESLSPETVENVAGVILDYLKDHHSVRPDGSPEYGTYHSACRGIEELIEQSRNAKGPLPTEAALELLGVIEDVIKDLAYNERQGGGVYVSDGQGRGQSIFALRF